MKNSFILYTEYSEQLRGLTDEQLGKLLRAIFAYQNTGKVFELEPIIELAFNFIKSDLDKNNLRWEEEKQKRSDAGKKGMQARWSKKDNTNVTNITNDNSVINTITKNNNDISKITKITDNVDVNVDVNVLTDSSTSMQTKEKEENVFAFWNNNIGPITPYQADTLKQYINDGIEEKVILLAIKDALENGKRNLKYISAILNNCINENVLTAEQFISRQAEFNQNKKNKERKNTKLDAVKHYNKNQDKIDYAKYIDNYVGDTG